MTKFMCRFFVFFSSFLQFALFVRCISAVFAALRWAMCVVFVYVRFRWGAGQGVYVFLACLLFPIVCLLNDSEVDNLVRCYVRQPLVNETIEDEQEKHK